MFSFRRAVQKNIVLLWNLLFCIVTYGVDEQVQKAMRVNMAVCFLIVRLLYQYINLMSFCFFCG